MYRYRWLFFINPNYYGFSSSAYLLLKEFDSNCAGNELECYVSTGDYTLTQFNFNETNPVLHVMVSANLYNIQWKSKVGTIQTAEIRTPEHLDNQDTRAP